MHLENRRAELFGSHRVMRRVSWIHMVPEVGLDLIDSAVDDHREIPWLTPDQANHRIGLPTSNILQISDPLGLATWRELNIDIQAVTPAQQLIAQLRRVGKFT